MTIRPSRLAPVVSFALIGCASSATTGGAFVPACGRFVFRSGPSAVLAGVRFSMDPIRTHGLTHVSLAVRDPERSLRFYERVVGVHEYFRDEQSIQVQGPGAYEVLAFVREAGRTGRV